MVGLMLAALGVLLALALLPVLLPLSVLVLGVVVLVAMPELGVVAVVVFVGWMAIHELAHLIERGIARMRARKRV